MSRNVLIVVFSFLFVGCASVPMAPQAESDKAKEFNPPSPGNAGLYIYRKSGAGTALKKDIWVNDQCVGESAQKVFFYTEVAGDTEHKVSTESEFSPNDLMIAVKSGGLYFIKQYIKMGLFVGGANLKLMNESQGKVDVLGLELAESGNCSR